MKKMNTAIRCTGILILAILLSLSLPALSQADMNDYCVVPPFVVAGVTPNLLLMIDNSASMYDLTYISAEDEYCYDNTYDNTNTYVGNFDPLKLYSSEGLEYAYYCSDDHVSSCAVDSECSGGQCVLRDTFEYSQFSEYAGAWPPVGCTYRTNYMCVTLGNTDPETVTQFVAGGNFLNWLSASKMDIQKMILTGGKYDTANGLLIGETRGCIGKRFIKKIPSGDWVVRPSADDSITFGVRGLVTEPHEPSTGGITRIDIFKGDFTFDENCKKAIDEWNCAIGGGSGCSYGQAQKYTEDCMQEHAGSKGKKVEPPYNHALQTCWMYYKHGQLPGTGDIQRIQNACENIYIKEGVDPSDMPPEYAKALVCVSDPNILDPSDNNDPGGYVGICWDHVNKVWQEAPPGTSPQNCIARELLDFCQTIQIGEVIDPSGESTGSDQLWNIPAFIIDSGILAQIGDPIWTYHARVESSEQTGLIQEFSDLIRFGMMAFNNYGSPTECLMPDSHITYTCNEPSNLDGGEVKHYIGDDSSGLISAINDIRAETWTPFAEGFYNAIGYFANRTDLRINETDFNEDKNPVQYRCQKNNILLITDGMSTTDLHDDVNNLVTSYNDGDGQIDTEISATCPAFAGSRNLDDLAWLAKNRNIQDFTQMPTADSINAQTITTHVVFSGVPTEDPGECNPDVLMSETAANGGGTYQRAEDPDELYTALREAFLTIAGRAASGTAASVLASGEGTGANLVQAIFYPERSFAGEEIMWTGSLKNLWYHIDPLLGDSTIREDTVEDMALLLNQDYIVHFCFKLCSTTTTECCSVDSDCPDGEICTTDNLTKALLFEDVNGDGQADSSTPAAVVYFENINSLWEAGARLWVRSADDREIFTTVDGSTKTGFVPGNAAALRDLLQEGTDAEAGRTISYVRGYDKFCSVTIDQPCTIDGDCPGVETCQHSLRNRLVKVDLNGDGDVFDTVDGIQEGVPRVWKLGDIINSTPRIVSWVPLNAYHKTYGDKTYEDYTGLETYTGRGMVIVGANDGMLHAFHLGTLEIFEERNKKAALSGESLGEEAWAFIPKNVLPYLKYTSEPGYCHLYLVDLTPYIFDASIGTDGCAESNYWDCTKTANTWRTIVIGGMRIGGACKDVCGSSNCVQTPAAGKGYSSYFALDITDPSSPEVLWEFTNESLGYSTTGPAIVRGSALTDGIPDNRKNGRWYVVLGSGPTGPIDTDTHQFKAFSDQNLRLFILDLADGTLLRTIDSGIQNAFAGSMIDSSIDYDQHDRTSSSYYQDDALYFGFVKAEADPLLATTKWNAGGVLRLTTKNGIDPATAHHEWVLSTVINTGPVTSAVAKLQGYKNYKAFLFWGTGRFYYRISDTIDDATNQRALYGVKEPCYGIEGFDFNCTTTVNFGALGDATDGASEDEDGWYILLDEAAGDLLAERNVTDTLAASIGAVFYTTTKPSADVCEFGGISHLWAVDWDTGGAVSSSILKGKAVMQVSTGSIEEVDLKTAFTERGGRRTAGVQGVPPAGTPPGILVPPKPTRKFIHIFEK